MMQVYFFSVLPDEVRKAHNVKSRHRFDLVASNTNGAQDVFSFLQTKKGKVGLYRQDPSSVIKDPNKVLDADHFNLTAGMFNITAALFHDSENHPTRACGYFNAKNRLKGGQLNPLRFNVYDGLLFNFNKTMDAFILFKIPDARGHIQTTLFSKFCEEQFDELVQELMDDAEQYFDYGFDWRSFYCSEFGGCSDQLQAA